MNNFDTSTSGVKIELDISWDICIGQHDFKENFHELGNGYLQFIDYGNFEKIDLADRNMYKITAKDLKSAILDYHMNDVESVSDVSRYYIGKPFSLLKKDEMFELVESCLNDRQERIEFFQTYAEPLYDIIKVTGYSQGDIAEVVFTHRDMKEYSYDNKLLFISNKRDYFEKLIYACPLFCRVTVDDEELDIHSLVDNNYEYDEDEIMKIADDHIVHIHKPYIMEWLKENLPTALDYR